MIFLFKNGSYQVYSPYMDERKAIKKFLKAKHRLEAVLIEASTSCHSDTFTVVTAEHFKTSIEPFEIGYTISMYDIEIPIDKEQSISRVIRVETPLELYNTTALIYQMNYTEDVGDSMSIGDRRIAITGLYIKTKSGTIVWDPDVEDLISFINRQGLSCDTDSFLDASLPPDKQIEEGVYITRYDRASCMNTLQYYFHDRKYYLWLYNGKWHKSLKRPTCIVRDAGVMNVYGICLNKTGVLYLATDVIASWLYDVDSASIVVSRGHWKKEHELWVSDDTQDHYYEAWNLPDILYMGLYLPQLWDVERYLTGLDVIDVSCEFVHNKRFAKHGEYHLKPQRDDCGLELDIFAIYSVILSKNPSYDIAFG